MLKRTLGLLLLALLLGSGPVAAQTEDLPIVSVPAAPVAPVLDGQVGEAEWARAAVLSDFVLPAGRGRPELRTVVFMQYDTTSIYLGALCYEPYLGRVVTQATERDGPVLEDDSLELVIDTMGTRQSAAQLAVSAAGVQLDAYGGDKSKDFKWTAATGRFEGGWSVELALPFAGGVGPELGDTWLINVVRHAAGAGERSSWAPIRERSQELQQLGTLVFSSPLFRVRMDEMGPVWLGPNVGSFRVQSLSASPDPLAAKLNVRVTGKARGDHFFNSEQIGVRQEPQVIGVPYRLVNDGPSRVIFSLTDARGQAVWRSTAYPVELPEISQHLRQLETSLSGAASAWARLADGEAKEALGSELEELLVAWRGLEARMRGREALSRGQYEQLGQEIQFMQGIAESLRRRMG